VETCAFQISGAIACKEHDYSQTAIIIHCIFQHPQLQDTVGYVLFAAAGIAAAEQLNIDSQVLDPIP